MKKFYLLLATLCCAVIVVAQERQSKHHLELSIGEPLSSLWGLNGQFLVYHPWEDAYFHDWSYVNRPSPQYGYEDEYFVPPIVVGYYNQVLSWYRPPLLNEECSLLINKEIRESRKIHGQIIK